MSTMYRLQLPVEQTKWKFDGKTETCFTWSTMISRAHCCSSMDKGKKQNGRRGTDRLVADLDPENPIDARRPGHPIFGHRYSEAMTRGERARLPSLQASRFSQFMARRGQGALIATAKIVQTCRTSIRKFYAATQVMTSTPCRGPDSRSLHEKFELAYPIIIGHLVPARRQGSADSRWDMTYLTMQILSRGWHWRRSAISRPVEEPNPPQTKKKTSLPPRSRPMSCRTRARHVALLAGSLCAITTRSSATPSATSARSSLSTACWTCATGSTARGLAAARIADEECCRSSSGLEAMNHVPQPIFRRIVPTVRISACGVARQEGRSRRWARSSSPIVDAGACSQRRACRRRVRRPALRLRDALPQ